MAQQLKNRPDEETRNPGRRDYEEKFGFQPDGRHDQGVDYDRQAFNNIANNLQDLEASTANQEAERSGTVQQRENQGARAANRWQTNVNQPSGTSRGRFSLRGMFSGRRKWLLGGMGIFAGVAGLGLIGFIPTGVAVNFKETSTRWSSKYQNVGNSFRSSGVLSKQFYGIPGCDDNTRWRCYNNRGVSEGQINRLRQLGFQLEGLRAVNDDASRFQFDEMIYEQPDGERIRITQDNFQHEYHNNPDFKNTLNKRLSPRAFLFRGKLTLDKVFRVFGIDRSEGVPDEQDREEQERAVRSKLQEYAAPVQLNADAPPQENETEGEQESRETGVDMIDDAVEEAEELGEDFVENGTDPGAIPTTSGLNKRGKILEIGRNIGNVALSGVKGAVKGPLTAVDNTCAFYQLLRVSNIMLQVYTVRPLIGLFMTLSTTVDQWKEGEATAAQMSYLGDAVTQPSIEEETAGLTFSDSPGYQLISDGVAGDLGDLSRFSAGFTATLAMQTILEFVGGQGGELKRTCGAVNSTAGQISMTILGIVACGATAGTSCILGAAGGVAAGGLFAAAGYYLVPVIAGILVGLYAPDPMTDPQRSYGVGTAFASGAALLGAHVGKANGFPFLRQNEYAALQQKTLDEQHTIAAADAIGDRQAGIFSTKNPMSATNRLATALAPFTSQAQTGVAGSLTAVGGIIQKSFASLGATAFAASPLDENSNLQDYRPDYCQSPGVTSNNIAITGFCTEVRGPAPDTLPPTDQSDYDAHPYSFERVADWMQNNDYIDNPPTTGDTVDDPLSEAKGDFQKFIEECIDDQLLFDYDGELINTDEEGRNHCMERDERTKKFQTYIQYKGVVSAISDVGNGTLGQASTGGGSDTTTAAPDEIDMENIYESSEDIACGDGTKDRGVHDGYRSGNKIRVRICEVENFPSSGAESSGQYGMDGATGGLLVNSRISSVIAKMAQDAKDDGVTLRATSGFRTMQHQQHLYDTLGGGTAAVPGTSNHQMGLAIDVTRGQTLSWFEGNANSYGLKQNSQSGGWEDWHWSPTGR